LPAAIPKGENSAALADWVETTLVNGTDKAMNFVRIGRLLKGEASEAAEQELQEGVVVEVDDGAEEDIDLAELGTEAEVERDARLDLLASEVKLRARLGANVYPFRLEGDRILKVDACGEAAYLLLLALSSPYASYRGDRRANEVEVAFDHVALAAMRRYLGRNADGLRFAKNSADSADPVSRPMLFSEAIEWLRGKLDVRSGNRQPDDDETEAPHWEWEGENPRPVLNTYNDGGVDLVVWWKFDDLRLGFPAMLIQCTVQLNWEDKLEDIPIELWRSWIDFSMVPPQRALVIPFSEDPKNSQWEDRSLRAGVVIDRVRLLELLSELDCETLTDLVDATAAEWATQELATV
jgi:hypothetical protein